MTSDRLGPPAVVETRLVHEGHRIPVGDVQGARVARSSTRPASGMCGERQTCRSA
jgi:hypothetical protein